MLVHVRAHTHMLSGAQYVCECAHAWVHASTHMSAHMWVGASVHAHVCTHEHVHVRCMTLHARSL